MRYYVTIGEREIAVDVEADGAVIDGRSLSAEICEVPGTPLRHLLVDGRSRRILALPAGGPGRWRLGVGGHDMAAEVVDERTRAIRLLTEATAPDRGPAPLKAPMPGLVMRIEVAEGQEVRAGDGVIIIEAMKMENELVAASDGVVARIHVAAGQPVERGALLVDFRVDPAGGAGEARG